VPFLVLLALVLPNFISSCHAADVGQASPKGKVENVVGFKLGGYIPQSSDLENFDIGGHGEVSVGWNLSQYFGIGTAIGYFETSNTTSVANISIDQTVKSTYLILNANLMIPMGAFVPYVEGGGGFYFTNIKESSSIASNSKEDTPFGYHAGAGLNWFFTKDYYIGLGGRYIWVATNDPNISLDGLLVDVNLGIRF
jgi:opacity protein-like surface antigen